TRRRWCILLSMLLITVATVAFVLRLPDRYTSDAMLVVVQQQVSQRYVEPTSNTSVSDAVKAMTREVLSRTRLLAVIDEFGLYSQLKKKMSPEGLVDLMRSDVGVEPIDAGQRNDVSAFKVAFTTDNP